MFPQDQHVEIPCLGKGGDGAGAEITASSRDRSVQVYTDTGGCFLPISPGSATYFRTLASLTASTRSRTLLTAVPGQMLCVLP